MEDLHDHHFMEVSYWSELWAARDLRQKAARYPSLKLNAQTEDEFRHAAMLVDAMRGEGHRLRGSLANAMQNAFFHRLGHLDLDGFGNESEELFWGLHDVMERRAIWCYKTYLRGGKVERYKATIRRILQDEKGHITEATSRHPKVRHLRHVDAQVFRRYIPSHFRDLNLIARPEFWQSYFGGKLPELADIQNINSFCDVP